MPDVKLLMHKLLSGVWVPVTQSDFTSSSSLPVYPQRYSNTILFKGIGFVNSGLNTSKIVIGGSFPQFSTIGDSASFSGDGFFSNYDYGSSSEISFSWTPSQSYAPLLKRNANLYLGDSANNTISSISFSYVKLPDKIDFSGLNESVLNASINTILIDNATGSIDFRNFVEPENLGVDTLDISDSVLGSVTGWEAIFPRTGRTCQINISSEDGSTLAPTDFDAMLSHLALKGGNDGTLLVVLPAERNPITSQNALDSDTLSGKGWVVNFISPP